jgi:hypothetical protein
MSTPPGNHLETCVNYGWNNNILVMLWLYCIYQSRLCGRRLIYHGRLSDNRRRGSWVICRLDYRAGAGLTICVNIVTTILRLVLPVDAIRIKTFVNVT